MGGVKFEASWIKEESCRRVIEEAWDANDSGEASMTASLSGVAASLKD